MKKDLVFNSTYDNIKRFIKDKDVFRLMELVTYINSTCFDTPAEGIQIEFIEEFFGIDEWATYVNRMGREREKEGTAYFSKYIPPFDLQTISSILMFETLKKARLVIEGFQLQADKLEKDSERALDNAIDEDGVFCKVEGFSNLYETLILHGIIKERS